MHGEKQNNVHNKLDQLQAVPASFGFNEEGTWQKLETRMGARRKKGLFFWLPVAAVFIALLANFFLFQSPVPEPVSKKPVETTVTQQAKNTVPVQQIIVKENKQQLTVKPVLPAKNKTASIHQIGNKQDTVFVTQQTPEVPAVQLPLIHAIDTVTVSVQKPKFKIAHVNELYPPKPVFLPVAQKNPAFARKKNVPVGIEDELPPEERSVVQKKQRSLFTSLLSLSQ